MRSACYLPDPHLHPELGVNEVLPYRRWDWGLHSPQFTNLLHLNPKDLLWHPCPSSTRSCVLDVKLWQACPPHAPWVCVHKQLFSTRLRRRTLLSCFNAFRETSSRGVSGLRAVFTSTVMLFQLSPRCWHWFPLPAQGVRVFSPPPHQ